MLDRTPRTRRSALSVAAFCALLAACGGESGSPVPTDAGSDADAQGDASTDVAADASDTGVSDSDGPDAPTGPRCGDGVVDTFEACDDGNQVTESACPYGVAFCDACTADCSESLFLEGPTCGDGHLDEENEVCDRDDLGDATCAGLVPESVEGTPRCAFDCQTVETGACRVPVCGDGAVEGTEACDDGNTVTETACPAGTRECTACSAACDQALALQGPFCGDGSVTAPEVCDDGNDVTEAACPYGVASCEVCSAGCDDVLTRTGPRCGDGVVDPVEACDGGGAPVPAACPWGTASCEACLADCSATVALTGPFCGDGVITDDLEVCDGAALGGVTCESLDAEFVGGALGCAADCTGFDTTACEGRPCGNGVIDDAEVCDDGNVTTEASCPYGVAMCERCDADCTTVLELTGPVCGDGAVDAREVCDAGTEGVGAECAYGEPTCAVCNASCDGYDVRVGPFCGDGNVDPVEACDDGEANGAPDQCTPWDCAGLVTVVAPTPEFLGGDEWGYNVAMNDRWVVVGQPFEEVAGESGMGALYVYERDGDTWTFSQRIRPPVTARYTAFGTELRVVGDEILTACRDCADRKGALLSYRHDGTSWSRAQTVAPAVADRPSVGGIAAITDDLAVLIAEYYSIGDYIGIPYLYERAGDGTWSTPTRLIGRLPEVYPSCGAAIDGETVVVGSCDYEGNRGALLVFERDGDGWSETQLLRPDGVEGTFPDTLSYFGSAITFVGHDIIVAGLRGIERPDGTGWMLAYERTADGWVAIDPPRLDEAGRPTSVGSILEGTSNRLAVGYNRAVDGVALPEISFFERRDGRWILQGTVRHTVRPVYTLGQSFSTWNGRLVVGSPFSNLFGDRQGAIWLY
ncbi:MAG: hypothetical protein H6700_06170 [Myxococcales bacterium]|nr:hypothetical protein [Myxococcales bacterium]